MSEPIQNSTLNSSINRPRIPGVQEFTYLLNAFNEAAVVLDLRTLFIYQSNPAFIQLTAFSQIELAGVTIVDILPDFSQEFFQSGEPLTANLARRKRNPIPVIVQGTLLNAEQTWGLLTFIPEAKHAESQGAWQSDMFSGFMELATIREEPSLEKSLLKGFEITRLMTRARKICIYKADGQQPRLIRISFDKQSEIFPEILPSSDLVQLSAPTIWIPGRKVVAEVQRSALVSNLSFVATTPLGQRNALFGLLVVGDQELQPSDRMENTLKVLSAHLTAALQHFILIDNLRKEVQAQKLTADVRGTVFEHSQEGILFISPDLHIIEINPAAEWMLQYAAWEVKNQLAANVVIGPDRMMTVLESCLQGIPTHNMGNVNVHRRNGQSFPAHIQVIPVMKDREVLGIVMFIRDISEHEQIRLRSQQLEQRAILGEFTAIFAHEVRNPINNISTGLQLVTARLPKEDVNVEVLNRMLGDCSRLDHLMESILAFSKPTELKLEKIDLDQFLHRLIDRWRPRLARVNVQPFISAAKNLPAINGDPRALEQVFTNLISNAIDAMSQNGGTLAIHVNPDHTLLNRPQVEVTVSDNGPGIPDEIRERMFEPFVTSKSHGTGLGLAITKRIVTAHQGNITVKSFPGGTIFHVYLPACSGE
ncbi:MAG: PAS domain S-box protein [Chloroflexi bacterium]|nr:PAS domain S-box protein [Chloroflexota bacterium]